LAARSIEQGDDVMKTLNWLRRAGWCAALGITTLSVGSVRADDDAAPAAKEAPAAEAAPAAKETPATKETPAAKAAPAIAPRTPRPPRTPVHRFHVRVP